MTAERVRVERDLCIGAAECVRIAAEAFELGDDLVAVVTDASAASDEQLAEAERRCPAGAIFLDETE